MDHRSIDVPFLFTTLDKFIELLGVLAAYSITVKELKALFAALKGESGRWVCIFHRIHLRLKKVVENGYS